jgi:hypothetical protein
MSKVSTRTKGKCSNEASQEDEKRALSETPEEKNKEKEETRNPFESTSLSSADEPKAVSSAFLSALKCVDGYDDDDDENPEATSKLERAPFVVYEGKEDIETGSRSSKQATSESPNTKARKATNVHKFRRKFDRDQQPSASAMIAATAPLALQALVPANHGDKDGDEQSSAGAILAASAAEARSRQLIRDEHTFIAHTDAQDASVPPILTQGGRFMRPGAVFVEGLGLITESDDIFELNTTTLPSQRAPVRDHHGDPGGLLVQATLVTEDPPMITAVADAVPDPPPTRFWRGSKFQSLILCLILVVGVSVGVSVGGSGSEPTMSFTLSSRPSLVPSTSPSTSTAPSTSTVPSTASSFGFEVLLAQSLLANSQDASLVEDTPEARAIKWLQDDPVAFNYTELGVLQRYALATLYYATDGENWIESAGWLDYDVAECDWFTTERLDLCIGDGRYRSLAVISNGLSGELPDALAILTDLQSINLGGNDLTGQLSSTLGSLSELRVLVLSETLLSGPVPSEYGLLLN